MRAGANTAGCFDFAARCAAINQCCSDCEKGGQCNKKTCDATKTEPPTVTTSYGPCTSATQSPTPTPTVCPPNPKNICAEGASWLHKFGPGHPVCGYPLPIVTCNDDSSTFSRGPFKLYENSDTLRSPIFPRSGLNNACQAACKYQLDQCIRSNSLTCFFKKFTRRSGLSGHGTQQTPAANLNTHDKRTVGLLKDILCKKQYAACLLANKHVDTSRCSSFCQK
ncbi:hypothetical protein NLG97_g3176 [Lecanicillium saksenae]|uniref:Uncharacterized protein n=1 Tax=Lecanicillium saksenae TaxID=468837 RepID=A0ACC1QZF3_9HYPO|nr:hypothetical protein NLG97_g3176 [Lecanicillium saksenae]